MMLVKRQAADVDADSLKTLHETVASSRQLTKLLDEYFLSVALDLHHLNTDEARAKLNITRDIASTLLGSFTEFRGVSGG